MMSSAWVVKQMILAGDIGGTNSRFGCVEARADGGWHVRNFAKFRVADYPRFDDALKAYLTGLDDTPRRAAFAAAGPVEDDHVKLTNTDWSICARRVENVHGIGICRIFNDFAGMTRSIHELKDDDFAVIRDGRARKDEPILVAGPGTGFGVGYLIPTRTGLHVLSTEGGHIAYGAQTALEFEVLQVLQQSRAFVSLELVTSGKGLPTIHEAVCKVHGQDYEYLEPDVIRQRAATGDPVCRDVCLVRAAATMTAVGDLALAGGARGGVVLAGGVSERMIGFYTQPDAMNRFLNRGARSNYIADIPVRLLKSPFAPLIGSAALLEDLS